MCQKSTAFLNPFDHQRFWLSLNREGRRNREERGKKNGKRGRSRFTLQWKTVEEGVFATSLAFQVMVDSMPTFKSAAPSAFRIMKTKGFWIRVQNSIFLSHLSPKTALFFIKVIRYTQSPPLGILNSSLILTSHSHPAATLCQLFHLKRNLFHHSTSRDYSNSLTRFLVSSPFSTTKTHIWSWMAIT